MMYDLYIDVFASQSEPILRFVVFEQQIPVSLR